MTDVESRLFFLEQLVSGRLQYDVQQLKVALAQLQNAQRVGDSGWFNGGAGGPGIGYYGCTLSADCPAGTPGTPATGQTAWAISSGARSNVTTDGEVYNDMPYDCPSGSQVVLGANPDGTYTVIGKVC